MDGGAARGGKIANSSFGWPACSTFNRFSANPAANRASPPTANPARDVRNLPSALTLHSFPIDSAAGAATWRAEPPVRLAKALNLLKQLFGTLHALRTGVTHARIITSRATTGITRRCLLRKLLLTPMSPVIHQGMMFAYGMAQQKFGFLAHGEVIMSNHWHSLTTPTAENLPEIFGKFIKVCLAEHGYEPPESVWSGSPRPNLGRMMPPRSPAQMGPLYSGQPRHRRTGLAGQ